MKIEPHQISRYTVLFIWGIFEEQGYLSFGGSFASECITSIVSGNMLATPLCRSNVMQSVTLLKVNGQDTVLQIRKIS